MKKIEIDEYALFYPTSRLLYRLYLQYSTLRGLHIIQLCDRKKSSKHLEVHYGDL